MNAAGDQHDRLASLDQFGSLATPNVWRAELAWVCKQLLNVLVFVESCEVFRSAYGGHHERLAHSRVAERLKFHAIARFCQSFKIRHYLTPARQLAIVSRHEAEHVFRGGNTRRRWHCFSNC